MQVDNEINAHRLVTSRSGAVNSIRTSKVHLQHNWYLCIQQQLPHSYRSSSSINYKANDQTRSLFFQNAQTRSSFQKVFIKASTKTYSRNLNNCELFTLHQYFGQKLFWDDIDTASLIQNDIVNNMSLFRFQGRDKDEFTSMNNRKVLCGSWTD